MNVGGKRLRITLIVTFACSSATFAGLPLSLAVIENCVKTALYKTSFQLNTISSPVPKARVSYCQSASSVVRPSDVYFSHFPTFLDIKLGKDEVLIHCIPLHYIFYITLHCVLFFGHIYSGTNPG